MIILIHSALMINQNFISIDSENKEYVYKIYTNNNNKTYVSKTIIVYTGKNNGIKIEVLSGINAGDMSGF